MKTSESLIKISKALLDAQRAITFAAKDSTNSHFKNKYADLPAVIDAIKEPLNGVGIVFLQTGSPSDDGCLHLTTRLVHESGEWIEDTLVMPLPKQDPQGFGSAMTYARRYALSAITGLYQDDDDGNKGSGIGNDAPQPERRPKADAFDLEAELSAMRGCEDAESLKKKFGAAWKRGNAAEKATLKEVYDATLKRIETVTA
jgi:hypothetical protein